MWVMVTVAVNGRFRAFLIRVVITTVSTQGIVERLAGIVRLTEIESGILGMKGLHLLPHLLHGVLKVAQV